MGAKSEEALGRSSTSESNGGGKAGISLRQGVIMAVATYTVITAFLLGRAYRNRADTIGDNSKFLISLRDRTISNALSEERLEEDVILFEEEPKRVVLDDRRNSSLVGKGMGAIVEEDTNNNEDVAEAVSVDPNDEDWRDDLYHSAVVFGLGYEEMLSSFKIYVYPRDDHAFAALSRLAGEGEARFTDELFFQLLYRSDFNTLEPEKAHLYLIPLSIRSVWNDVFIGPSRIGRFLNKYVQGIRDDYPYWQRTLGADHALLVCHDYKEDGSRNCLELKKNVIQVSCSPLVGAQTFYPHKDFAVPPFRGDTDLSVVGDLVGSSERTKLVYHSGRDSSELTRMWEGDSDFVLVAQDAAVDIHHRHLALSKYCLILMPEDTANVVDALRLGCVPILVSDGRMYDLPFQDVLNWNQFTVILSTKNLKNLKVLLQEISQEQYRRKQLLAVEASKHLEWHNPPKDQDAFYMTLYDLWIRRHAIRYMEREDL